MPGALCLGLGFPVQRRQGHTRAYPEMGQRSVEGTGELARDVRGEVSGKSKQYVQISDGMT